MSSVPNGFEAVFREFGVLAHSLRTVAVATVTECERVVIDGDRLHEFFVTHSRNGYQESLETVVERLTSTNGRVLLAGV